MAAAGLLLVALPPSLSALIAALPRSWARHWHPSLEQSLALGKQSGSKWRAKNGSSVGVGLGVEGGDAGSQRIPCHDNDGVSDRAEMQTEDKPMGSCEWIDVSFPRPISVSGQTDTKRFMSLFNTSIPILQKNMVSLPTSEKHQWYPKTTHDRHLPASSCGAISAGASSCTGGGREYRCGGCSPGPW